MDDLDDIALLRKKALASRSRKVLSKGYDYEEQLQLHPHEELEMSYNAAKKRAAKKKAAKRKPVKETSKKTEEEEKPKPKAKEDDPMIHFVNPHGGFMPYSTLSLAVKRTQDIGHVSPISSESPSPVNLYAREEPPTMAAVPPAVKTTVQPPETKQAALPMKESAVTKQVVMKSEKPVATSQAKETASRAEPTPKKEPVAKKPLSRPQRKDSHSRSSSSDSSSSFSSSSGSSFSSNSSASRHRKRRRRSSSSSSSSRSSSTVSSSTSSSSSSGSRRSSENSRKRKRRSKRHDSEQRRSTRRRSVERNHDSHYSRNKISRPDDGTNRWQNYRGNRFNSQRGRDYYRPGGFQRGRTFSDGGGGRFYRNEPQEYQRDIRIHRPFTRPFGRGRQGFMRDRQNFNSPQFRSTNFRGRGRDFRSRPFGLRHRLDSQSNFRSNERFVRRRDDDSRSPEHGSRQHRRGSSAERHQSSRSDRRSPHTRYDSKIGAPIKESRDHVERRPRVYSESNQSRYSDRSSERRSRSPLKSTDRVQSEEDSEVELELQPESDLELAPPKRVVNSHTHHSDSDHSGSHYSKERGKPQGKKRRSSSSSSSSSSTASSSSDSSSEDTPERNRRIKSPIRVSPERREYKGKQGAAIHLKDHSEDNAYRHPRSQGQKRLHSDPDTSLDAVSKRLRPDLALRLGPDPELSTRGSQHDEFVSSRQRRFYNNSAGVQPAKGNALEIARNFRLQKQKTTSMVSTTSKAIVKSTVTDNSTVKPDDVVKESDPEREKELSDRIRKIKEQNEKILQRQKEIEDDIELYA